MKLYIVAFFIGAVAAEKLDNTYLPPLSAKTAGGSGSFLSTPFQGGRPFGGFSGSSFGKIGSGFPASYVAPTNYNNQQGALILPSQGGFPQAPRPEYGVPGGNAVYKTGIQHSYYPKEVQILRYNNDNSGDGTYHFDYETENKISQQEHGQLKNAGTNQESSVVQGTYSYAAPDGQVITVNYVADENGFQASGAHLPVPPPIPEAIQKSLLVNAASDGAYDHGSAGLSGQYQLNRQYLTPNTQQSGYHY